MCLPMYHPSLIFFLSLYLSLSLPLPIKQDDDETANTGSVTTPTKCVWCSESLTGQDSPKLLECLHVSCGRCLTTKFDQIDRTQPRLLHCPVCNMASQQDLIIDNQFLIEHTAANVDEAATAAEGDPKVTNLFKIR